MKSKHRILKAVPLVASAALLMSACGGGGSETPVAQEAGSAPVSAATEADSNAAATAPEAAAKPESGSKASSAQEGAAVAAAPASGASKAQSAPKAARSAATAPKAAAGDSNAPKGSSAALTQARGSESAAQKDVNQKIYEAKNGATARGVTKDTIRLGSINAWGMALGNIAAGPLTRGNMATATAINDRGGILGRRLTITDCDDGAGEVSRMKGCVKKLVHQDKIFSLITAWDWATASIHDDLKQHKLPYIGAWAYSQTEWQDPWMFPTHMSMIHEAMTSGHWVKNVMRPKTYGLLCLTSPEMQIACNEVKKILEPTGAKLVKKVDVSISDSSMSPYVLSMRAANPDVIIHYTVNPATITKFAVESAQQGYWPTKGIAGNHFAGEIVGALIGKWPAGRYWTNTTYKMWGKGFMSTMHKYARGNAGLNYHIVQSGYVGLNMFAKAGKEVGPNLTVERLMAVLANGEWKSDADLGAKFVYTAAERGDKWRDDTSMGREYMYKYISHNTISNPNGDPTGWEADKDQFVIYTRK